MATLETENIHNNLEHNIEDNIEHNPGNNLDNNSLLTAEIIEEKSDRLRRIKSRIEKMDKNNQISALFMISKNNKIKYSENNNGTFINLTSIDENMLVKIEEFIEYIELQKCDIEDIENKKQHIENIYFKQNKD
jgi:hypothetical protein